MGQNLAVQTVLAPDGGAGFLHVDAQGNLLVSTDITPSDIAPLVASSGNVAAAPAVATLAKAAGKTTYISGLLITGLGASAGSAALVTISGLLGGSQTFNVGVPAGVTVPIAPINLRFDPPLPASAVNTDIVVTVASFGSGNTAASVIASGFRQ